MSAESLAHPSAASPANSVAGSAGETPSPGSAQLLRLESELPRIEDSLTLAADSPLAGLPVQLDVIVPIPSFRVQDLLVLEKGTVLESRWSHTEDVPVWCGGTQLVWAEFEVVDQKLAVRVTRIG